MLKEHTNIVWFRHDLRLSDNPALCAAIKAGSVIPIFIYDTAVYASTELGGASKWWLHHSLTQLNEALNGHLQIFKGDAKTLLPELINELGCEGAYWNRTYEPEKIARDKKIKATLKEQGTYCESFNGSLLWEPWTIAKADGDRYKVFTPYYRKGCLQAPAPRYPLSAPSNIHFSDVVSEAAIALEALELLPTIPWDKGFYQQWQSGEQAAKTLLSEFIEKAAQAYRADRDTPSIKGTSRLSPYLRWGEISPNQIWYAILDHFGGATDDSIDTYLSEIGWREFSYYMLYHFPQLQTQNYSPKFAHFPWQENQGHLQAWQNGQTGIPIIDAGMRELWQTGYMHNRVRMVVGSFLVKNLLIDWREGERWFWDCLCDADMASNSASWQWVAGCGSDAAPYFRVFNPVLQGEKFDKQGTYVKTYCPELSRLPDKYIHKPWEAPQNIMDAIKLKLGSDYPRPIVDLKQSRLRALDAFATTKNATN